MPLILQPLPADPSGIACADQDIKQPTVARYEGQLVVGRKPAVRVWQGQEASIRVVMRNDDGNPIDLSSCACISGTSDSSSGSSLSSSSSNSSSAEYLDDCGVRVRFLEALSFQCGVTPQEVAGEIHDAAAGEVTFTIPEQAVCNPGVIQCQIAGFTNGRMLFANEVFILAERSLFATDIKQGPPTWNEIKLALRDSCPEDSYLNDEMEWDLAEVCQAIILPVQYYNETKPIMRGRRYNTYTFPGRVSWLNGVLAHLYRIAATTYRRESITYSAAGVALNDKAKTAEYEAKAQEYETLFRNWVSQNKAQANREKSYGWVPGW